MARIQVDFLPCPVASDLATGHMERVERVVICGASPVAINLLGIDDCLTLNRGSSGTTPTRSMDFESVA
jgi:hypothetical protein